MLTHASEELFATPLLRGMTPTEVEQFVEMSEKMYLSPWTKVFEAGTTGQSLYIVLEGTVQILLEGVGDRPSTLAELHASDVFGESNFFHAAPHHATALCTSGAVLLQFPRVRYDELLAANSPLALRIGANAAEVLAARLQKTDEWVRDFLTGHLREHAHDHWLAFRQGISHGFTKTGFMVGGIQG